MGTNDNLSLIKARYEAVNGHDFEKFQGFYDKSIVWEDPGLAAPIKGPAAVRRRLEEWVGSFPDLKWKLGRIFSQDEDVCAEFTFTGTLKGKLKDPRGQTALSATNKKILIRAVGVYTVRRNKIVDSKIYFDFGNLRAQLEKSTKGARKAKS